MPGLSPTDLEFILQGSSQIALFVVCEYLFKNISEQRNPKGLLQLLVGSMLGWRIGIANFQRNS